ncbi:MAG TPA: NnrU family protein [Burkholderiaceae bacterium]|jgi:uncharacterized membrane protein|nr:NnrU family protein [Burkholderiaceae bacterium]
MIVLVIGLALFLGVHSVRIVADDWRSATMTRIGERRWKGVHSLLAALGLVLIVWGYGIARTDPVVVWQPPLWTRHLAALLMLPAFVLLVAAYVPGNRIKAAVGHPMVLGVKLWAVAHLASNGTLADIVLFGSFLVWAVLDFRSARRRLPGEGTTALRLPPGEESAPVPMLAAPDLIVIALGLIGWAVFGMLLHAWLIGVRPF